MYYKNNCKYEEIFIINLYGTPEEKRILEAILKGKICVSIFMLANKVKRRIKYECKTS